MDYYQFEGSATALAAKLNEGDYVWSAWEKGGHSRVYCKDGRGRDKGWLQLRQPGYWENRLNGNCALTAERALGRSVRELPEVAAVAESAATPAPQSIAVPEGRNRRAQACSDCGQLCNPGEGLLENVALDDGDPADWHVFCVGREECAVRKAARKVARQEVRRQADEKRKLLDAIREEFRKGESPKLSALPTGEKIEIASDVLVIAEPEHVWLLSYNGRDGDLWEINNVAGSWIGNRLPRTEEMLSRLRALK
jgi:hypothetical protein